ncbi:EFR1 family ferrodoxin [Thermodesulfobacteriota bacterium]
MTKSIVVYFSQTGNTKKIAEAIRSGMIRTMGECDISTLKTIGVKDLIKYDLIGLGYPTWSSKEPPNVRTFVEQMVFMEGKHIFVFSTHGARPAGLISSIVPLLRQKGLTVIGFRDWYGSVTLPHMPKPYLTDGHPDEIDLKEAEDFGRETAELSRRIQSGENYLIPLLTDKSDKELHGQREKTPTDLIEARRIAKTQMRINLEKCTECNLCVQNCPVNAIDFTVSPPVFKVDLCVPCWFCEQICPTGAIEVDWEALTRVYDKHNEIELNATLDAAEARGCFRRLVPREDIKWGAQYWYQLSKYPRIIIS